MSTETAENPTAEAPEVQVRDLTDEESLVVSMVSKHLTNANNHADVVLAASNTTKMVHDVLNTAETEDEFILKFRQTLAALDAKREEIVTNATKYATEKYVKNADEASVNASREAYGPLKDKIVNGLGLIGLSVADLPSVGLPPLKTLRGGNAGGGSGAGKPKPRVSLITFVGPDGNEVRAEKITEKDGKQVATSNFSVAAQMISKAFGETVESSAIQEGCFAEAKTTDLKNAPEGSSWTFVVSAGDKNVSVTVHK